MKTFKKMTSDELLDTYRSVIVAAARLTARQGLLEQEMRRRQTAGHRKSWDAETVAKWEGIKWLPDEDGE